MSRRYDKPQAQTEFVYCWDSEKNKREFPEDFGTQCARHGNSENATKYWPSPFKTARQCGKNSVIAKKNSLLRISGQKGKIPFAYM
jgi:hypothetical protein